MAFNFIFMLTANDRTIPDARERLDEVLAGGARHIGFKDVGLPFDDLKGLADDIRAAGGRSYLEVVSLDADSELASARGEVEPAIAALEHAVALQDGLAYMEPPPWYYPVRQSLGAVLLESERAADAERVYRTDLLHNPRNGWSLYGLSQSLRVQGRDAEADWAEQGFRNAWARADVELAASRF